MIFKKTALFCMFLLSVSTAKSQQSLNINLLSNLDYNYDLSDVDHNRSSIIDEIIKLNDLKKKGLLTEEEYTKAKEKILD